MGLSQKMTAIANRIRTLLGVSSSMGLDSMATHLDAAQAEVDTQGDLISQIAAVLARKAAGIVPAGEIKITENGTHDVTTYASAVVDVQSLPAGISKLSICTFTPKSDVAAVYIAHGLGERPNFYFFFTLSGVGDGKAMWSKFGLRQKRDRFSETAAGQHVIVYNDSGGSPTSVTKSYADSDVTAETIYHATGNTYTWKAGETYYCVSGVLDALS